MNTIISFPGIKISRERAKKRKFPKFQSVYNQNKCLDSEESHQNITTILAAIMKTLTSAWRSQLQRNSLFPELA